ncbi:MAG: molybdopterin converting factor, large subunit [Paenibacillaceae bacterium]|nr:molybdopterin converting factor, large subunit [Paenibacillaceae bacterium]
MRLTIRLFASLTEKMGGSSVTLETEQEQLTAGELKALLASRYPEAAGTINISFVAKNQSYAKHEDTVSSTDELALIPPVSGGASAAASCQSLSGSDDSSPSLYELTFSPLDPESIAAKVAENNNGANLVFTGTTRELTCGDRTLSLQYDAYYPMAQATLQQIGREIADRWEGARCAISHRLGAVGIGETSVVIAVSAPHRNECYEASRYAIERLKQIVPIWKQEQRESGRQWQLQQNESWDPTAGSIVLTEDESTL